MTLKTSRSAQIMMGEVPQGERILREKKTDQKDGEDANPRDGDSKA